MLINVFAIDPGMTTGWAFIRGADPALGPQIECDYYTEASQINGVEYQQAFDLYRLIKSCWPCAVVIEGFIVRRMNQERYFLSPVRVTSGVAMLLWLDKIVWAEQQPSLAKTTIGDDYLVSTGLWTPGMPHANDAMRHGLTLVRRIANAPGMYDVLISPRGLDNGGPVEWQS